MTWGIGEDVIPESEDVPDIDWRTYSETHELTQKQQKVAEKIRQKIKWMTLDAHTYNVL